MKTKHEATIILLIHVFLFPFLIEWLWNMLLPGLTGVGVISYWQAFGLRWLWRFFASDSSKVYLLAIHKSICGEE